MREIHQSAYNPDELAMEVIEEIVSLVDALGAPLEHDRVALLEGDRELFTKVANGDDSNETRDKWQSAEEDWKRWSWDNYGVQVYDDGEAGWTYVGTTEEIEEFLNKQEEEV